MPTEVRDECKQSMRLPRMRVCRLPRWTVACSPGGAPRTGGGSCPTFTSGITAPHPRCYTLHGQPQPFHLSPLIRREHELVNSETSHLLDDKLETRTGIHP
jgi:hypothetical protein